LKTIVVVKFFIINFDNFFKARMTNNNKTILITGATSGIGRASAELFAKNGWNTILTGRRKERLEELKGALESSYNIRVLTLCFDVQNREEVKNTVALHASEIAKTDVLLNNAGLALGKSSFENGVESDWETMIDTNLKGLIYMTKELIPIMKSKKSGHIINISSTAARDVYPGGNVYSASKFAVDGLTRSLRIDLLPLQIKVTSITPGMVDTEFSEVRFHGDKSKADAVYNGFTPLHAEDIADAIFYAATRPAHVNIGDIVITCTAQATSNITFKS
jgi:NADP-dependent 3-hydroxy acid dehydrogenase YdfG